jgi:hypothetical protein
MNYHNQCPDVLMVRVRQGEEDWVFGWHAELNERGNLGPVNRT